MARAKRTDRAEARRRYRAEIAGPDDVGEEGADGEGSATPTPSAGRSRPSGGRPSNPPGRIGIAAAFRQSIHPINVRGDLTALPGLITNKALWVPVLLTVASTVLILATGATNFLTALLFTYFVQSPAIGGVFIAGFLAPRASWLLGVIVGLVSAAGYSAIVLSGVVNGVAGAPTQAQARDVISFLAFFLPLLCACSPPVRPGIAGSSSCRTRTAAGRRRPSAAAAAVVADLAPGPPRRARSRPRRGPALTQARRPASYPAFRHRGWRSVLPQTLDSLLCRVNRTPQSEA